MGIIKFGSSSSYDKKYNCGNDYSTPQVKLPNPDPSNFKIRKHKQYGKYLLVIIKYPDCKNYEGNKILLYKNAEIDDLKNQGSIDPHFSNNREYHTPVARFEPTDNGWLMAETLAITMDNCDKMRAYTH